MTHMKTLTAAALILAAILPSSLCGQQNIVGFFPFADSISKSPPLMNELKILGQKKVMNRHITIVGFAEDKSILLAAVTLDPIKDIRKELSLSVRFKKMIPDMGQISTWGYIFDRNKDGKVDYMALVGGAAAYKDSEFPEDFPYKGQPLQHSQMEYYITHCKLVFNHWADDNFDGVLDALVHIDMDPDRDFVERELLARSTAFNGKFDDVLAFRSTEGILPDTVLHTMTTVPYHPIAKPSSFITQPMLDEKSEIMKLLNTAVKQLKLTATNFARLSTAQ